MIITRRQFLCDLAKGRWVLRYARGLRRRGPRWYAHRRASSSLVGPSMAVHRIELQRPLEGGAGHFSFALFKLALSTRDKHTNNNKQWLTNIATQCPFFFFLQSFSARENPFLIFYFQWRVCVVIFTWRLFVVQLSLSQERKKGPLEPRECDSLLKLLAAAA